MWRFIYLAKSQNEKGWLERKGQMLFLFCPPHRTSFCNPSPFEYDCSWRLPESERWKGNPSCKDQPSTLKAPHAQFQLPTAPNYMFLTFENALGQQVPLSLVYCSHVITLCLPSPTLNPLHFMKISIIVMYPKGEKVGKQGRCNPLAHAASFTAWSPCFEVLCLITSLLLQEKESSWGHTCTVRAVTANPCSFTTGTLLVAAESKAAAGIHDLSSRWSWQSCREDRVRWTQPWATVGTEDGAVEQDWIPSESMKERQQTVQGRLVVSLQGVNTRGHILSLWNVQELCPLNSSKEDDGAVRSMLLTKEALCLTRVINPTQGDPWGYNIAGQKLSFAFNSLCCILHSQKLRWRFIYSHIHPPGWWKLINQAYQNSQAASSAEGWVAHKRPREWAPVPWTTQ